MYTCCPICKTNFSVTEAQLQVAQGKVRCGSCKNVFNARLHIHYTPSKPVQNDPKPKTAATRQAEKSPTTAKVPQKQSNTHKNKPVNQPESTTNKPATDIDAIFNALDTQLSKGTYIDIAKTTKPDIREANFADFSDDTDINDTTKNPQNIFQKPNENNDDNRTDNELDLNLYHEDSQPDTDTAEPAQAAKKLNNSTQKENTGSEKDNTSKQQHTFDFISLPDEPELPTETKEQLDTVSSPMEMPATNRLVTKTDNDDLHQIIDNIINVNNTITTPFEENDADHFVIEMQSEADVELVDENDIDKLFASTDSLKMSDLKFDKHRTPVSDTHTEQDNNIDILPGSEDSSSDALNVNISLDEPAPDPGSSYRQPAEVAETIDNDEKLIDLEAEFEQPKFEEEIVLSSNKQADDVVPHRLRDAVASLEDQPVSLQKRILYSIAIIALLAFTGFQLVLFKSTSFANTFPILQPLLSSMCQTLPCRYTGNHNRNMIKILSRDVRLHPKIKGALLISATITNQASYSQPYPTILLKFTDLTGATVAQRYFQPREYLGLLNKPFAQMPSKKPVQLNIEILDPGSDAINFQFYFL